MITFLPRAVGLVPNTAIALARYGTEADELSMNMAGDDAILTGQVALVTGGTRGLGLGLARALGRRGMRVALVGRDGATGREAASRLSGEGIVVRAYAADVADRAALCAVAQAVQADIGAIDLLLCAAGIGAPRKPVWEAASEDFRACFEINLLGVMNCMAAVMPAMIGRGQGNVVAIGGTYGHKGVANFAVYCASKWALRGLVKSAALDAAPHGVRVNMISPGGVEGERLHRMFAETARRNGEPDDAPLKRFLSGTALGRLVTEEDVAGALFHLVEPSGRMIIGQDIVVDSGMVV